MTYVKRHTPGTFTALGILTIAALSAPLSADEAVDNFLDTTETAPALKDTWKTKIWASNGAGPTGSAKQSGQGLTLEAGSSVKGAPGSGFSITRLARFTPIITGEEAIDVNMGVTVDKLPTTPYGKSPAAKLLIGLSPEKGQPDISALVGMVRAQGQPTLHVEITTDLFGEKNVIIEKALPDFRAKRGSKLVFVIQGKTLDLTLNGETLIEGPIEHGIDWNDAAFKGKQLLPQVALYKLFGKKSANVTITEYVINGESVRLGDNDIIGDQLGSTAFLAEPVFEPVEKLVADVGEPHTISAHFFGLNGNLTSLGSEPWDNENFTASMQAIAPGHMRYPAGTIANYWDWNIGWIEQEMDSSQFLHWTRSVAKQKTRYTLEDFAKGQREVGFAPVYVMNMVTRDLDDQLEQLRRAKEMGMPVELVELGNEYYFGAGAEPLVHKNFPTPKDYALAANKWAAAIKKEFPEVSISAVGTAGVSEGTSERRETWNDEVAPVLSDDIDAITMHPYSGIGMFAGRPNGHWGNEGQQAKQRELLLDPAAVQHAILTPTKEWMQIMGETGKVKKQIWATEFNANDWFGGVRGTWTQTLAVLAAYDGFLRDPRVQLASLHNAVGGVLFPAVHADTETFSGALPESGRSRKHGRRQQWVWLPHNSPLSPMAVKMRLRSILEVRLRNVSKAWTQQSQWCAAGFLPTRTRNSSRRPF